MQSHFFTANKRSVNYLKEISLQHKLMSEDRQRVWSSIIVTNIQIKRPLNKLNIINCDFVCQLIHR